MLGFTRFVLHNQKTVAVQSSEHTFTDREAEGVANRAAPEVAHCLVPWPHKPGLHWKDRCESAPVSPSELRSPSSRPGRSVISSARVGSASRPGAKFLALPLKPGLRTGPKSMCQHPTMLKAESLVRIPNLPVTLTFSFQWSPLLLSSLLCCGS